MLRNGFIMKVGQALCSDHTPSDWASRCTTDGHTENDLSAGAAFFRAALPARVQLGIDLDNGVAPIVSYFSPINTQAAEGHAGILDLELTR
jgi:hypothetical protein